MSEILSFITNANDPVIFIIVGFMCLCVLLELSRLLIKNPLNLRHSFKSVIISAGILGTFIGIFQGLQSFNTKDITESIPKLLDGLKTAFITSISGMVSAIILAFLENLITQDPDTQEEVLQDVLKEQKQINSNTKKILQSALQSKNSIDQNFKTVNQSLGKALETLSKGATQEIISALNGVISDFNNNLKEQFGENFKQLNESVKKMLIWQENYKTAIEQMEKSMQQTVKSMQTTSEYTKQFTGYYEKISHVIKVNQNQIISIEEHLKSLKKIGEDAGLITKSISQFSKEIQKSLSEQSASLSAQSEDVTSLKETLRRELKSSLDNLNTALTSLTDKFRKDYEVYLNHFKNLLNKLPPKPEDKI